MKNEQISIEMIERFSNNYDKDINNKILEETIVTNGIENTCIEKNIIAENKPIFSIELPDSKRYDQKNSKKCWIYAGFNLIKHNIAQNLGMDVYDLNLSNSYISFFDKLEKSNNVYEYIIKSSDTTFEHIHKEKFVEFSVIESGGWEWFRAIVNKYGIMPYDNMPDSYESLNSDKIYEIFNEKVMKDILKLIELKKNNENIEKLKEEKTNYIEENYFLLSKILGKPSRKFDYKYTNKENKVIELENITPKIFKEKFLSINLDDFVTIANLPMYNKKYNEMYKVKNFGNVHSKSQINILNLSIEDIKELVIKQLKDGLPIYFGTNINKSRLWEEKILDTRIFNYEKYLNIEILSKEESLNLYNIKSQHSMVLCGVHTEENEIIRWKVEDSYGDEENNGYYIMNNNFFEKFVFTVVIDKKYLNEKQLELLKQEKKIIDIEDIY